MPVSDDDILAGTPFAKGGAGVSDRDILAGTPFEQSGGGMYQPPDFSDFGIKGDRNAPFGVAGAGRSVRGANPNAAADMRNWIGELGAAGVRGIASMPQTAAQTIASPVVGPEAAREIGQQMPGAQLAQDMAPTRDDRIGRIASAVGGLPGMLAGGVPGMAAQGFNSTLDRTGGRMDAALLSAAVNAGAGMVPLGAVARSGMGPLAQAGAAGVGMGLTNVGAEQINEQIARAAGAIPQDTHPTEAFLSGVLFGAGHSGLRSLAERGGSPPTPEAALQQAMGPQTKPEVPGIPVQDTIPIQHGIEDWLRWAGAKVPEAPPVDPVARVFMQDSPKAEGGAASQTIQATQGPLPVEPGVDPASRGPVIHRPFGAQPYDLPPEAPAERPTIPVQEGFEPTQNADRGPWQERQSYDVQGQYPPRLPPTGIWSDPSGEVATTPSPGIAPELTVAEPVAVQETQRNATPIVKPNDANAIPRKAPARMTTPQLRAELEAGGVEIPDGTSRADMVSGVKQLREQAASPSPERPSISEPAPEVPPAIKPEAKKPGEEGVGVAGAHGERVPEMVATDASGEPRSFASEGEAERYRGSIGSPDSAVSIERGGRWWVQARGQFEREAAPKPSLPESVAQTVPNRIDRARSVIRMGAKSPHVQEFGGVRGARAAIQEEQSNVQVQQAAEGRDVQGAQGGQGQEQAQGIRQGEQRPPEPLPDEQRPEQAVRQGVLSSPRVETALPKTQVERSLRSGLGDQAWQLNPGNAGKLHRTPKSAILREIGTSGEVTTPDENYTRLMALTKSHELKGDFGPNTNTLVGIDPQKVQIGDRWRLDDEWTMEVADADEHTVTVEAIRSPRFSGDTGARVPFRVGLDKPLPGNKRSFVRGDASDLMQQPERATVPQRYARPAKGSGTQPYTGEFKPVPGQQQGLLGDRYAGGITGKQEGLPFARPSQASEEAAQKPAEHPSEANTGRLFDRAQTRQPIWKMTSAEHFEAAKRGGLPDTPQMRAAAQEEHQSAVTDAIRAGRPVPDRVLNDLGMQPGGASEPPIASGRSTRSPDTYSIVDAITSGMADPRASIHAGKPSPFSDLIGGKVEKATEAAKNAFGRINGTMFPALTRASAGSSAAGSRYLGARAWVAEAAPFMAREVVGPPEGRGWLGRMLGKKIDPEFDRLLGATLVESKQRAVRSGYENEAKQLDAKGLSAEAKAARENAAKVTSIVGGNGSPFKTEADYQAALKDPRIRAGDERYANIVNYEMDRMFAATKGLEPDELDKFQGDTQARVNVKVLQADEDGKAVASVGGGRGNLKNPRLKRSPFDVRAKGTGQRFELSASELIKHTLTQQAERAAQHEWYQQMERDGLMKYGQRGQPVQFEGGPGREIPNVKKRGPLELSAYVDPKVYGEVRAALAVDEPLKLPAVAALAKAANVSALASTAEMVIHTGNLLARTVMADHLGEGRLLHALRPWGGSITDLGVSLSRVAKRTADGLLHAGNFDEKATEIAKMGAGRAPAGESSWANPVTKAVGASGRVIHFVDKVARVLRDDGFDAMVEAGAVRGTPDELATLRRDYINQLGQYDSRAYMPFNRAAKETGISPFLTAGQTMLRESVRDALAIPDVPRANAGLQTQAIAYKAARIAGHVASIGALNYVMWKEFWPKGVPFGSVKVGEDEDGRPKYIDALDIIGLRRGMKMLGMNAAIEGSRRGDQTERVMGRVGRDQINAILSPYMGPAARAGYTAATGRTTPFAPMEKVAKPGEDQQIVNLKEAGKQMLPLHSLAKSQGDDSQEPAQQLLPRFTPKTAPPLSRQEKMPKIIDAATLNTYADDLASRARKVPKAQRREFVENEIKGMEQADQAKVRKALYLKKRIMAE